VRNSTNNPANTDRELRDWLRWAAEEGNAPAFVRKVAEAALIACSPDYALLRPALVELKHQHPEPPHGPAASLDPELFGWLCWDSTGGHVPSFVRSLVGAAVCTCSPDYELLRPVLAELKRRCPEPSRSSPGHLSARTNIGS
jgi:hypothetical protein